MMEINPGRYLYQIKQVRQFKDRLFFIMLLLLALSLVGGSTKSHAKPCAGNILVADHHAGTDGYGALFWVDPATGCRTLLSDFGVQAQGQRAYQTNDVEVEADGTILVAEFATDYLFRVNPTTGMRTVLSDFNDPTQGPTGMAPADAVIEMLGTILVIDPSAGLFRVDPETGARTLLSDFENPDQGPTGVIPQSIALEESGAILITDPGETADEGILFRVDPGTGARTILSNFSYTDQGPLGQNPAGVAVETTGNILVVDNERDVLFRVDPGTGARTILSNFSYTDQGPLGVNPLGVTVEVAGTILIVDSQAGFEPGSQGLLFRVNPGTGARTILSDFNNSTQGPLGAGPVDAAIYPELPFTTSPSPIPLFSNTLAMMPLGLVIGILVLGIRRRR
ncbi:MAG: hypothetical protein ACFFCW_20230 [Candidatus Hodarchaeota archaeon]